MTNVVANLSNGVDEQFACAVVVDPSNELSALLYGKALDAKDMPEWDV